MRSSDSVCCFVVVAIVGFFLGVFLTRSRINYKKKATDFIRYVKSFFARLRCLCGKKKVTIAPDPVSYYHTFDDDVTGEDEGSNYYFIRE